MISRAQNSSFANWWWTVDRWLLGALGLLMSLGIVLAMAGSPAVAERLGLNSFFFVRHQIEFMLPAAALIIVALMFGHEVKGSRRRVFGSQPSEFVKPAVVILAAWAFSQGAKRKDVPGNILAILLLPLTVVPLILQPDFGQTMLLSIVWAALFFMAGLHLFWVLGLGGMGMVGVFAAYKLVPHVRDRILHFLDPANGPGASDTFQVDTALGLVTLFGVQSCINMAVNLHLMPAKGMTLPFISYGGSSLISLALGMGFLIAVTRKRPRATVLDDAGALA